ncbi:membrane protein [Actinomycetes bacterium]|jgi:VIT1/CCC1 family predicted Fe2+/Mn2+ transporter|nr:membrane protein [Actinomycetes bacterium]
MSPHDEDHSSHRIGLLRAMVLGANDGIISTTCLVLGVAAATAERSTILTAGMAGLVAGAASMALGEYVSVSSQRDSEQSDIAKEKWELEHTPEIELAELAGIYRKKGLPQALAHEVAVELTKHDALKTHLAEELGIHEATRARPIQASVGSAGSFAVGAAIPLIAVSLFTEAMRFTGTIAVVVLTLIALGVSSSKYGGAKPARPVLRVVIGGLIAIAITIAVGDLFGAAVA